jgi:hypothetical protein
MKKKIAYAVFTLTGSGLDYMVKGNFGEDKDAAQKWADVFSRGGSYPNGLFVKKVEY